MPLTFAVLALMVTPVLSPRAVVEQEFRAFNAHDVEGLAAVYAPDAVIIQSDTCQPMQGTAALRAGHQALFAAMPDISAEVTDWVEDGDRVAVLFTGKSKALPGGSIQIADFFTVKGGKIVRDVTIFNAGGACK